MTKNILIIFGTRPEAIKMAPLVKALQSNTDTFHTKVCVTAQHRTMLDQVLDLFDIEPDYDLDIMEQGQDLYDITSRILLGMKSILNDFQPDLVFVHGDTSTTFAAALASFYQQIPVAHIEAGLRTGDIYAPWPEEANRKLTTQITAFHFAPTSISKNNLIKENVPKEQICVTGNTVIDALFLALDKIKNDAALEKQIVQKLSENHYIPSENRKLILVTGHRRENHGQGFINICKALKQLAESNTDFDIVYPVHLNPNVQQPVKTLLSDIPNIYLIDPLQYEQFIYLMHKAYFIITDSGGVQEEAPSLGKPVLVMRETTERPEAVQAGTVKLVGTDTDTIVSESQTLIDNPKAYEQMSQASNPYGDGHACQQIIDFLKDTYGKSK